jgi:tetratricopeptide (TPR) repeat protein
MTLIPQTQIVSLCCLFSPSVRVVSIKSAPVFPGLHSQAAGPRINSVKLLHGWNDLLPMIDAVGRFHPTRQAEDSMLHRRKQCCDRVRHSHWITGFVIGIAMVAVWASPSAVSAAETLNDCRAAIQRGNYEEGLRIAAAAVTGGSYGEDWPMLKAHCELLLGKYPEALTSTQTGIYKYAWSVRLRWLEFQCLLANGQRDRAPAALQEIERLASATPWRYTDADDLVALGQAALKLGADPADVLEGFYDRARTNHPKRPDGYLAAGLLACSTEDFQLAAEILKPAADLFPEDPEIHFALATALASGDHSTSTTHLQRSLELNPRFVPALQQVAEQQILAEDYADARVTLDKVLAVNPDCPEGHALIAVIHILQGNDPAATESRQGAIRYSGENPSVDYLIGRKLSQRYRFEDGAKFQRQALATDTGFTEARIQLARDLLRTGNDAEGWDLAVQAREVNKYSVALFNLLQLRKTLDSFTTLTGEHIELRMDRREADVYGDEALQLLEEAYTVLSTRYGSAPVQPLIVEIFPRADDFAVRTFDIPDVSGFLGVCFGHLITINSPANRRDHPANWKSVLWHEFCHVVTLQMTGNKIPRWLSEGISVFEERQRDQRWGQQMTPTYRDRILAGNVTPIRSLSRAFLTASDGNDLNFAYFQSSLVVQQIIQEHGLEALTSILKDLQAGILLNDSLDRRTKGLDHLEQSFKDFLTAEAGRYAPGAEFSEVPAEILSAEDTAPLEQFLKDHPKNIPAGLQLATRYILSNQPQQAESQLRFILSLVPEDVDSAALTLLAKIYRQQNNAEQEEDTLRKIVGLSADNLPAAMRLQQLLAERHKPNEVIEVGQLIGSIDPFQQSSLQQTAAAAETIQDTRSAQAALGRLLQLQPDQAAGLHLRMAVQCKETNPDQARKHALLSLAAAPEYREAHRLLLQLQTSAEQSPRVSQ